MKRDMDLVRELLLKLEAMPGGPGRRITFEVGDDLTIPEYSSDEINYHLGQLYKAGYVTSGDTSDRMMSGQWVFSSLTWEGHDFIDAVRDPDVWRRTKAGASKVGSWSVGLLLDMAKAYSRLKAKQVLGLDL